MMNLKEVQERINSILCENDNFQEIAEQLYTIASDLAGYDAPVCLVSSLEDIATDVDNLTQDTEAYFIFAEDGVEAYELTEDQVDDLSDDVFLISAYNFRKDFLPSILTITGTAGKIANLESRLEAAIKRIDNLTSNAPIGAQA